MLEILRESQRWPVKEQTAGSYIATITDDLGNLLPGSTLTSLKLTLYVIRQDGSTAIVNGRNHQDVFNVNNVQVFDVLQTLPNGQTYNLRWNFQVADTTLVEALPFESHYFLFEWVWPQGVGKDDGVLVIENLVLVP